MLLLATSLVLTICGTLAYSPPLHRISPPRDALVVRGNTTRTEEYPSIMAAVWALPNDTTSQSIFIYPGTYHEQVYLSRPGPVSLYGYTKFAGSQEANEVVITNSLVASVAGSDEASGTLRIHTNNTQVYNINIRNDYGPGLFGGQNQAIAASVYGDKVGFYASGLYGFQDTVYTNTGRHAFLHGYIEGSVDFIFGKLSQAYFEANTIAIAGPGCITADGRSTNDSGIYLLESNTITVAPNANYSVSAMNGQYYFGRPWRNYARVIFKNTHIIKPMINAALWSIWSEATPLTDEVTYADYNTWGPGVPWNVSQARANFSTHLTTKQAATYNIGFALGSDWHTWVDSSYLL
ncbi:carbohydrate esterase family 8 protein [Peniophora sp. CONT]|nr:carbohydrate esterase family 8 protein [Peniophora sp. CONT]